MSLLDEDMCLAPLFGVVQYYYCFLKQKALTQGQKEYCVSVGMYPVATPKNKDSHHILIGHLG